MLNFQIETKTKIQRLSQTSRKSSKPRDKDISIKLRTPFSRQSIRKSSKLNYTFQEIKPFRVNDFSEVLNEEKADKSRRTTLERKNINRMTKVEQNVMLNYFIKFEGNNAERVRQLLNDRGNWARCFSKSGQNQIDFYWDSSNHLKSKQKNQQPLFGRISGSYELTDKARLHDNIVNYCSKFKISNELFLPVTFCFTTRLMRSEVIENVTDFLQYFQEIQDHTSLANSWILKPTNLNQGRNIFLFNSLKRLLSLLLNQHYSNSVTQDHTISTLDTNQTKQHNFSAKFSTFKSTHEIRSLANRKTTLRKANSFSFETKDIKQNQFTRSNQAKNKRFKSLRLFQHLTLQQNSILSLLQSRKLHPLTPSQNISNFHLKSRQKSFKLNTFNVRNISNPKEFEFKSQQSMSLKSTKIEHKWNQMSEEKTLQQQKLQQRILKAISDIVEGRSNLANQKAQRKQIVIQKYIENPYLINGNKFDIRIWVLVDQRSNFYIFKSGYLRFSSEKYKLDNKSIENNFIHLTNHAVQKYNEKYEKDTNIVRMSYLKEYLQMNYPKTADKSYEQKYDEIEREIERIITISLQATLGHFFKQQHNKQKFNFNSEFELFGFDFLLDRQLKIRLIEANCNPSITEDNLYLRQAVPRMLNDLFKLTIDKVYFPRNISKAMFSMKGYSDDNMWKKLGKIGQVDLKSIQFSYQ